MIGHGRTWKVGEAIWGISGGATSIRHAGQFVAAACAGSRWHNVPEEDRT